MKSSATVLDIGEKGLKDYFNNYNIIFLYHPISFDGQIDDVYCHPELS